MYKFLILTAALVFSGNSLHANAANIDKSVLEAFAKPSQYLDVKISPTGQYLASTSRNKDDTISLTAE